MRTFHYHQHANLSQILRMLVTFIWMNVLHGLFSSKVVQVLKWLQRQALKLAIFIFVFNQFVIITCYFYLGIFCISLWKLLLCLAKMLLMSRQHIRYTNNDREFKLLRYSIGKDKNKKVLSCLKYFHLFDNTKSLTRKIHNPANLCFL